MSCRDCDMRSHLNVYVQYFANVSAAALRSEAAKEDPARRRTLGLRLRDIDDSVYKTCDTDLGACLSASARVLLLPIELPSGEPVRCASASHTSQIWLAFIHVTVPSPACTSTEASTKFFRVFGGRARRDNGNNLAGEPR